MRSNAGVLAVNNVNKAELLADQFDNAFNRFDGCSPVTFPPIELEPEWQCDPQFIIDQLQKLPVNKAPGSDGITVRMLKETSHQIAPSLASLFNRCLAEGIYPTQWKHAIITPVPKMGNSMDPADYRPISLLSIISKIFERHLWYLLLPYVDPLLSENQFGFRSQRSTVDALCLFEKVVCDGWQCCADRSVPTKVCVVFWDVCKAFDSVPHGRLLTCLESMYGVPMYLLCMLKSYLTNRTHSVRVGSSVSSARKVVSGTIQGSAIGPLLFLSYINSITTLPLSMSHVIGFADDLAYVKTLDRAESETELREDLKIISGHFSSLSLNPNLYKTKYMILSVSTTPPPSALSLVAPLYVNNTLIERVQSYKYLGVHVDPKLSFDLHVRNKVASAKRMLGCLSRVVRKHVPSIIAKVYMAVIRPSLLYAIPISYPYYERDKCALEKVQKYACKLSLNRFNLPYDTMLRELKWLKITKFVFQSGIFLMYKYVICYVFYQLCVLYLKVTLACVDLTD